MLPSKFDGIIDGCDGWYICLIWALFLHYLYVTHVIYLYASNYIKEYIGNEEE
jgi:hypothetical protein